MTTSREAMQAALKSIVVPRLRTIAFKGSFPHFRRVVGDHIDLLTFQFDRNGGGFVIEISFCPTDGIATPWGEAIAPQRVTAWDVHPDKRYRIQPSKGAGTDSWFRFEDGGYESCANQVLEYLPFAESWWSRNASPMPNPSINTDAGDKAATGYAKR